MQCCISINGGGNRVGKWVNLKYSDNFVFPFSNIDKLYVDNVLSFLTFTESYIFLRDCYNRLKNDGKLILKFVDLDRVFDNSDGDVLKNVYDGNIVKSLLHSYNYKTLWNSALAINFLSGCGFNVHLKNHISDDYCLIIARKNINAESD